VDPSVLHCSLTVDPATHECRGGCASKPQSRFGPICPRVHGSLMKLPGSDETAMLPNRRASDVGRHTPCSSPLNASISVAETRSEIATRTSPPLKLPVFELIAPIA
jgi:hypothetical protein